MRRFNIMRPLLLLACAYFVYSLTLFICSFFQITEDAAKNIAFVAMMVTAIIVFQRMNRNKRRK